MKQGAFPHSSFHNTPSGHCHLVLRLPECQALCKSSVNICWMSKQLSKQNQKIILSLCQHLTAVKFSFIGISYLEKQQYILFARRIWLGVWFSKMLCDCPFNSLHLNENKSLRVILWNLPGINISWLLPVDLLSRAYQWNFLWRCVCLSSKQPNKVYIH